MNKNRSQNYFGLVIKISKNRESDLIVTLLIKELGKIKVVAKGACKLNSTKRAALEPGNLIQTQLVKTKNWPLLIQAKLIEDAGETRVDLNRIKRLFLFLEIFDLIMTEEEIPFVLWQKVLYLRALIIKNLNIKLIRQEFRNVLAELGYVDNKKEMQSVCALVNEVTESQLCTYKYLQI